MNSIFIHRIGRGIIRGLWIAMALALGSAPAAARVIAPAADLPHVADNEALKATAGSQSPRVMRDGFMKSGDGGQAIYDWSSANCTVADDGAQVQPAVTGCWVADLSGMKPTPLIWGAKGDGLADDTAKVQAAIDHFGRSARRDTAGLTLYIGNNLYKVGALTLSSHLTIEGDLGPVWKNANSCPAGFVAAADNLNLITFAANSHGITLRNLCILMAAAQGTNNSGAAIYMPRIGLFHTIEHTTIINPGTGIDLNGNTIIVTRSSIEQIANKGCHGIRIGHETTNKSTLGVRVTNTVIQGNTTGNLCDAAVLVEDVGGLIFDMNDILGCHTGTKIRPAAHCLA